MAARNSSILMLWLPLLFFVTVSCDARTVTTWGRADCVDWNKERKDKDSELLVSGDVRWIEGYLSALNINFGTKDTLKDIDVDVIRDWLDAYCRKNPNGHGSDAAEELFSRLSK